MTQPARKPAPDSPKATAAILSSFWRVRILYYAAAKPVQSVRILERLRSHGCSIAPYNLNRILLRMHRNGWLKNKSPPRGVRPTHRAYSLTHKGREALHLARKRLSLLATLQQTKR